MWKTLVAATVFSLINLCAVSIVVARNIDTANERVSLEQLEERKEFDRVLKKLASVMHKYNLLLEKQSQNAAPPDYSGYEDTIRVTSPRGGSRTRVYRGPATLYLCFDLYEYGLEPDVVPKALCVREDPFAGDPGVTPSGFLAY